MEHADLRREQSELTLDPAGELYELAAIYRDRGLDRDLAQRVAEQLSAGDVVAAHARDELGQRLESRSRPFQASWVSAASFSGGAAIPLIAFVVAPSALRTGLIVVSALGLLGAQIGGAPRAKAAARVLVGGGLAMTITALVGRIAGAAGI